MIIGTDIPAATSAGKATATAGMPAGALPARLVDEIVELAIANNLAAVLLYGSRARGDYKRTSDIDLATRGGNASAFAADVEEATSTLLRFDCVNLDGPVDDQLRDAIDREGVLLYEEDR